MRRRKKEERWPEKDSLRLRGQRKFKAALEYTR